MATQDEINALYQQILGRPADSGGLQHYMDKLNASGSDPYDITWLSNDLKNSAEYQAATSSPTTTSSPASSGSSATASAGTPVSGDMGLYIQKMYSDLFNRVPSPDEVKYWTDKFNATPEVETQEKIKSYLSEGASGDDLKALQGNATKTDPYDKAKDYGKNIGQSTVDWALGAAKDALPGSSPSMPDWYGGQLKAPVQMGYYGYTQNASPYTKVGGIGNAGYDAVYNSLANEAKTAYDRALTEGDNRFGANGLYGSQGQGLQSDYMAQAQKQYQQGLLDANKTRYGLQMQDMQNIDAQNQFGWKAGQTDAESKNNYNLGKLGWDYSQANAQNDFFNNNLQAKYNYDLANRNDIITQNQRKYENALALGTGANPNTAANLSAQTQQNINAANNRTASNNALWQGVGSIAGGLLGNQKLMGNVWDWATSSGGGGSSDVSSALGDLYDQYGGWE